MTDLYVNNGGSVTVNGVSLGAGNDTTGNGTAATPYASIKKALSIATGGSVQTIWVTPGTYAEDSGSGYLSDAVARANVVTIAPMSGLQDVIITGTSGPYAVLLGGQKLYLDNIIIRTQASTNTAALRLTGNAVASLTFNRCRFQALTPTGGSGTGQCVTTAFTSGGTGIADIEFSNCDFEELGTPSGTANVAALIFDATTPGTAARVRLINNRVKVSGRGFKLFACTDVQVVENNVNCYGTTVSVHPLELGVDGTGGATCTGIVTGNVFRSINGHAAVIGSGCNGVFVTKNRFYGGGNSSNGQGLVIKEAQNVRLEDNDVFGGYLSGLYFKAAVDCQAFNNRIYNRYSTSPALRVGVNSEDSAANQRLTIRRNVFYALAGTVLGFGTSSDDSGGSVVDENVYVVTGSATLGSVRGTSVTTLSGLRAAWSGYDKTNNDRNSRLGARPPFAGTPLLDLPA